MWTPKYTAGTSVGVNTEFLTIEGCSDNIIFAKIIYPFWDGKYLLQLPSGGYVMAKEEWIEKPISIEPKQIDASKVSVVVWANGEFAIRPIAALIENGYNIKCVVTSNAKTPVYKFAKRHGVRILFDVVKDYETSTIRDMAPMVGIVIDYKKLPRDLYDIPRWGTINVHSSLLPAYRGASPIQSAIANNDVMTGVTVIQVNDNIDMGDIINNMAIPIKADDNATMLRNRLSTYACVLLSDAINRVINRISPAQQKDIDCDFVRPSHTRKLTRDDRRIIWSQSAESVCLFVRKFFQSQSSWTTLFNANGNHRLLNIHRCSVTDIPKSAGDVSGQVLVDFRHGRILVACIDYYVSIDSLTPSGMKTMSGKAFVNGLHQSKGMICISTDDADSGLLISSVL